MLFRELDVALDLQQLFVTEEVLVCCAADGIIKGILCLLGPLLKQLLHLCGDEQIVIIRQVIWIKEVLLLHYFYLLDLFLLFNLNILYFLYIFDLFISLAIVLRTLTHD